MILKSKHEDNFKARFYFLFIFYTLLFLFYPGNTYYFDIFAFNRNLFAEDKSPKQELVKRSIPYLRINQPPKVSAEGIYIVDLESFTPIFERSAHTKFLPASTTKVITALVAYDIYSPDDVITIKNPRGEGQTIGLVDGERITFENLLYGMLVHSGNDAAYALAGARDYNQFVGLMNEKANKLNMKHSHFTNPAGLDNPENYSTPYDMALAARELLRNKDLSRIVSIRDITISDVDFKYFHRLTNVNKLLGEVAGLGGLKTGYTETAGENLISFYKHGGHDYIIVVLKSLDRFEDTKNIINWMNSNVDYITP